jgi:hypothetical protein
MRYFKQTDIVNYSKTNSAISFACLKNPDAGTPEDIYSLNGETVVNADYLQEILSPQEWRNLTSSVIMNLNF